ncbi:NAD(P)/FAD-dependent oxidoreductase [Streptomyces sp. NPDC101175]|uniref:NAD(P)/FAD-dependent oxidoreductase n=1 Tax=Streptomyces sp. NPDC101175 TaxID=3366123 RepID=UPI0038395FC9
MSAPHAPERAEAVVVGAGLIGMFTALSLAQRDIDVVLIDDIVNQKRSFKVGESFLVSTALPRTIGRLDKFLDEECFVKLGVWFTEGMEGAESFAPRSEWSIAPLSEHTLAEQSEDHRDHYLFQSAEDKLWFRCLAVDQQIVRPEAEDELRATVRAHPRIRFLDSARVTDVHVEADAPNIVTWADRGSSETGEVVADWIVDCSGRNRMLTRKFGHAIEKEIIAEDGFQTTSIWGQFNDITDEQFAPVWEYREANGGSTPRDKYTVHLWGEGYWIWVIRLSKDRISVGVIFDQRTPLSGGTPREQFFGLIDRYPVLRDVLTEERLLEFRMYRNTQYMTDTFVHPHGYGMVGDSSSIIDAYYSQGIGLSCQQLWHLTNVIESDVRGGTLERAYIDRINRNARQDWLMIRNMLREKFTPAIQDPRYFLLTHLMDLVVLWSTGTARSDFATWLVRTDGETKREGPSERRLRARLSKRLFYSRSQPWAWLPPETVQRVQSHMQRKIAERARWRLEHGSEVPGFHCQISIARPLPRLWRVFTSGAQGVVDVSPLDQIAPPALRRPSSRRPLAHRIPMSVNTRLKWVLNLRTHGVIGILAYGYALDAADTAVRKIRHRLSGRGPVQAPTPQTTGDSVPAEALPPNATTPS